MWYNIPEVEWHLQIYFVAEAGNASIPIYWYQNKYGHQSQVSKFVVLKYVLRSSSRISQKSGTLIVRYSQKQEWISFVLATIVLRILQLLTTLEPLVQFGWGFSAKCTSPNEHVNRKVKMSHVQLQTDFPRSDHIITFCLLNYQNVKIY